MRISSVVRSTPVLIGLALLSVSLGATWAYHSLQGPEPAPASKSLDAESICGPYSLKIACARLGIATNLSELIERCRTTPEGTRFGDIERVARELGCQATMSRLKWPELSALDSVAILFVDGNHFAAADLRERPTPEEGAGRVRIYEPGEVSRWYSQPDLSARWRGETLVLRALPAASARGPRAAWDSLWIDRGYVYSDESSLLYRVRVKNAGTEPLTLKVESTSCSCTSSTPPRSPLPPGESSDFEARVDLHGQRGHFEQTLVVATSDPRQPRVVVTLCGGVYPNAVTSVDKLYLGEHPAGSRPLGTFYVHDPGTKSLDVTGQGALVNFIPAAPDGMPVEVPCRVTLRKVEPEGPDVGASGRYAVQAGDYRVDVELPAAAELPPGRLEGRVTLDTNLPRHLKTLKVAVAGTILPDLVARPGAFLFTPTASRTKLLQLSRPSGRAVEIAAAEVRGVEGIAVHRDQKAAQEPLRVELSETASPTGDSQEGHILIRLKDGTSLEIPVVVLAGVVGGDEPAREEPRGPAAAPENPP